ncbi:MAG: rod shape-determining protein MreD [Deltaproteobacteria bacterium]|nr:rod shape-determining protein MreD [Deltaproteobacteria bacterium]
MNFLFLWLFSFFILIVQVALLDLVFQGKIALELTMVLVIYAGLCLNLMKGGILTFIIGFSYDSVASVVPGIFVVVYMLIFFIAKLISDKVRVENPVFIMAFTCVSMFLEGIVIFFVYDFLLDINLSYLLFLKVFLPQALIVSAVSPVVFFLLRRFEVLISAGES